MSYKKLILISGVAGVGKTTLAKRIALKFDIDKVISIDTILSVARLFLSKKNEPYLYVTTHSASSIENLSVIEAFYKHCEIVNNLILKLFNYELNDKVIILEGAQVNEKLISSLESNFEILHFNLVCNKKILMEHYRKKALLRKSSWVENINNILCLQNHLRKLYMRNNIFIRNNDYDPISDIEKKIMGFLGNK